ncbi:MAG TPA: hypothetical protein VMZ69_03580 [Saprospiraceae bacterium]|nr:hypothetical protein [Saprospiraceae bacterium]
MCKPSVFILLILIVLVACKRPKYLNPPAPNGSFVISDSLLSGVVDNGALLLTRFKSLPELKSVINIKYGDVASPSADALPENSRVQLTYNSRGHRVTSILDAGISEADFVRARDGNIWDRLMIGIRSPYGVLNSKDLMRIEHLGRKRPPLFGKGDVAFYNLAETMVKNISEDDVIHMSSEELSEKGYLNTFNHITAQAFMTSIFSEKLADFVADIHERRRMPQLVTGTFTEDQLTDLENGPVDNYIDLINNEWGQELGKLLRKKYSITRKTQWSPALLANYLNDIQSYHSWAFQIAFRPFRPTDEIVIRFAAKINLLMEGLPKLKSYNNS